jgi:hypothetical protein
MLQSALLKDCSPCKVSLKSEMFTRRATALILLWHAGSLGDWSATPIGAVPTMAFRPTMLSVAHEGKVLWDDCCTEILLERSSSMTVR